MCDEGEFFCFCLVGWMDGSDLETGYSSLELGDLENIQQLDYHPNKKPAWMGQLLEPVCCVVKFIGLGEWPFTYFAAP